MCYERFGRIERIWPVKILRNAWNRHTDVRIFYRFDSNQWYAKSRHDRNAFYHLEYLGGSPINHSEKDISESTSNAVMEGSGGGLYYIRPIWFPAGYSGE